jgi:cardiolipin synthase
VKRSDIPNLLTVLRIALVGPIAWLLLQRQFGLALGLFAFAGLSDGLDGFLAKRFGWTSRLGALLDPLADKALLVACYAVLTWIELLPLWLLVLVVSRDVVIVSGAVVYNFRIRRLEAQPTFISKLNTVLQIVLVLTVIIREIEPRVQAGWIQALTYAVTASVVWSGLDYVVTWSRRARESE